MKTRFVSITLATLICSAPLGFFTTPAAAGGISRSASFTGPGGKTVSRSVSASRSGSGTANWSKTATGPKGGTVSRSGSCTAGSGCNRSASVTGPDGRTLTSQHSAQANGLGGLDRTATYTTPTGTASRSVDTYRGPNRTVRKVTDTGANGDSAQRTVVWE